MVPPLVRSVTSWLTTFSQADIATLFPAFSALSWELFLFFISCTFAYRWTTDYSSCPHHQHSAVSTAPILSRNTPTTPCPTLSWKNREANFFWSLSQGEFRAWGGGRFLVSLSSFLVWCQERIFCFSAFFFPRFTWGKELHCAVWLLPFAAASLAAASLAAASLAAASLAAASLAALSACSFPSIPLWLGIHLTVTFLPWTWSCLAL